MSVILILYTTLYRTGGDKFTLAAATMEKNKQREFPSHEIISVGVESKSEFLAQIEKVAQKGKTIRQLHFIGHSGVYGIMFGTTKWPEQFSPYEWKQLSLPKTDETELFFHACRTGRWFAPFISRTLGVKAYGYFWYTTISAKQDRFIWEKFRTVKDEYYIVSCPGKKSHGLLASLTKYLGLTKTFPLLEFNLKNQNIDASYDAVADHYDDTFSDIKVRADEWNWIKNHFDLLQGKKVLDIGCGNAALLQELSSSIDSGVGIDASRGMISQAQKRNAQRKNLQFHVINGPHIPLEDNSVDTIISMLSFRYLDWDPLVHEMLRVLKPGGEIMILDMVAAPVKIFELPQFVISKLKYLFQKMTHPQYHQTLNKMVSDPAWKKMLEFNPIRSEHEMKWYLESRFPERKIQKINIGWNSRIISFRSGPIHFKKVEKLSYP